MGIPLRLLIAEDAEDDARLVVRELERGGYEPTVERVETAAAMQAALDRNNWDLVIGDYSMPHFSGPAALALLREHDPDTPFIFVSGTIGEDVAVEAMKAGAQDYLIKGNLRRLIPAIQRELQDADVRRERRRAQRALLERARLAELTAEVGAALSLGLALRPTLQRCAEALVRHLDVAFARIWLLNEATNTLELEASAGMYTHIDGAHSRVLVGRAKIGRIAEQRRPQLTNQVVGDPDVTDQAWAQREGMVAFAGYPLLLQDRLLGVMAMFARHALSEFVPKALASVSSAVAVGVERKRAEAALRQSEQRFAKVFAASPIGIAISTLADGRYLDANDAFVRLVGRTRDEVLGHTTVELGILSTAADRAAILGRMESGSAHDLDVTLRAKDGSARHVLCSLEQIDIGGEPCLLALVHDVTQARLLEQQLRQSQKMEAVGRLAGGVAHDFNNLLTVITSYCDLLLDSFAPDDSRRADVGEVRKAADGAAGLTRQLLSFSRQQVLQPRVLDLNASVRNTESLLKRLLGEDVQLVTTLASGLGMVKVDPSHLEQIIMNLAVNARDAMPEGGRVTLETANVEMDEVYVRGHATAQPGRYVVLAVSDTGIGMDEATQARMFEPFFTTKEPGKGTGLGLATVYGVVKQAGGFIWVYSEPGRGASFKVYLPRVDEPADAPAAPPTGPAPRGTETVLLVEDAAAVRTVTRQVLERQGYTVLEAPSGDVALQIAAKHHGPIHLLLTDVVMPGVSGRQLAERLVGLRPEIVVLYTSGYTDDAVVRHGVLEAGVAYLQKPFTADRLAHRVREVLGPRRDA
ncbi:MAG TPA: response regulator [Gemmatimonadales bacterium]|jgi:PAS domain S-box-containing protein|nr:response regulator [Gemmatimonadales bacterium]